MFISSMLSLVAATCCMLIVSAELNAAINAVKFNKKLGIGKKGSRVNAFKFHAVRYLWGSFLLQQVFAKAADCRARYCVSTSMLIFHACVIIGVVATDGTMPIGDLIGAAFVVSGSFFTVREGKQFRATVYHREKVLAQTNVYAV